MDVKEELVQWKRLSGEFVELSQLVMKSESNSFLKQVGAKTPSEEEREEARREVGRRGGRDGVWDRLRAVQVERERIGQELRTWIRRSGLKAVLPLLDGKSYEQLLLAAGRLEISRLTPDPGKIGALPAGAESDVRSLVREFGGGKYQVTHPAIEGSEDRREFLEFGGAPKEREFMEVLSSWGLRIQEGE